MILSRGKIPTPQEGRRELIEAIGRLYDEMPDVEGIAIRIEPGIKEHIFKGNPQAMSDAAFRVLLSYQIQGSYYAYSQNRKELGDEKVLDILDQIASHMRMFRI